MPPTDRPSDDGARPNFTLGSPQTNKQRMARIYKASASQMHAWPDDVGLRARARCQQKISVPNARLNEEQLRGKKEKKKTRYTKLVFKLGRFSSFHVFRNAASRDPPVHTSGMAAGIPYASCGTPLTSTAGVMQIE